MKINQPEDYYDRIYFDNLSPLGMFHRSRVAAILAAVPFGSNVLDLGCSSGLISNLLSVKKCQVTGVDIRPECIEYAKKGSHNDFLTADITTVNLNHEFDVVVCSDVIEHFNKNGRSQVLGVIDKHLKSGGLLIMTTPGPLEHLIEPLWKLWRRFRNPGVVFDDEGIHELVRELETTALLGQKYKLLSRRLSGFGLVKTLAFRNN